MSMTFFMISLIGFAIAHRILLIFVPTSKKNFVRRFIGAFFIGLTLIFFRKISSLIFILGIFLFTQLFLSVVFEKLRQKEFEKWIFALIDEVILHLRTNKSMKASIEAALTSIKKEEIRKEFEKIYANSLNIQNKVTKKEPLKPQNIFAELYELDQLRFSTLEQVILYRKHLKLIYTLRHKSGQAAFQARIQAMILLFIFIFLSLAMVFFFGWNRLETFFVTACLPMTLGLILVFRMGSWFKWKI